MFLFELLAIYLGCEMLIGMPAAMYFYVKNWDVGENGIPRMLRYFPLAGWFFRKLVSKESMVDTPLPRVVVTPNLVAFVVCGILGFLVVVWFTMQVGNGSEWANKQDHGMAIGFGILGDIFLMFVAAVVFVVYGLVMLLLYFLLIHNPAKKKKVDELQEQLWEAKRQAREASAKAVENNSQPPV